jgi:hypothetical protein
VKKSVASTPLAWARRNSTQVGPSRRGAGGSLWRRRMLATLPFETVTPSSFSSPTMRRYPQRGFSLARRTMSSMSPLGAAVAPDGGVGKSRVWVSPMPPDEGPMPSQDRLGRDEKRRPLLAWHQLCQSGDERPVRLGEPGPADLPAKDRQLMTEHQDLRVFGDGVHAVERQRFDDAAEQTVEEAERYGRAGSPLGSCPVKGDDRIVGPFTSTPPFLHTTPGRREAGAASTAGSSALESRRGGQPAGVDRTARSATSLHGAGLLFAVAAGRLIPVGYGTVGVGGRLGEVGRPGPLRRCR